MPGQRHYSYAHRQLRKTIGRAVKAGLARCARCEKPISPLEPWDLGRIDGDRTRYAGPDTDAATGPLRAGVAAALRGIGELGPSRRSMGRGVEVPAAKAPDAAPGCPGLALSTPVGTSSLQGGPDEQRAQELHLTSSLRCAFFLTRSATFILDPAGRNRDPSARRLCRRWARIPHRSPWIHTADRGPKAIRSSSIVRWNSRRISRT
jgi:hypothetical protein